MRYGEIGQVEARIGFITRYGLARRGIVRLVKARHSKDRNYFRGAVCLGLACSGMDGTVGLGNARMGIIFKVIAMWRGWVCSVGPGKVG